MKPLFPRDAIQVGCSPINWSNDDLPELGGHISFSQCISEMQQAGYEGCEVGVKFSRDPKQLSPALQAKNLQVASAWFSSYFTDPKRSAETPEHFFQHVQFLKAMGARVVVVAECGHGIQLKPVGVVQNKPEFSDSEWDQVCLGLHELGRMAQKQGLQVVYHPHMGTGVQSMEDIVQLMESTDPKWVSLLLDTGHTFFAKGDSVRLIQQYHDRIRHVHLKDIRKAVMDRVYEEDWSFLEAVKRGVFTVPGDGCIDFRPIFKALSEVQYQGWWVVEAEQDPQLADPYTYAKQGREYIQELTGV